MATKVPGSAACSDVAEVVEVLPICLASVASWLHMLLRWRRDGKSYPLLVLQWFCTIFGLCFIFMSSFFLYVVLFLDINVVSSDLLQFISQFK